MATAKGKRPAAKKRRANRFVQNSKAAHALSIINAEDSAIRKKLILLLGRQRYRRACTGERVPINDLPEIEKLTGKRVREKLWEVPAEGPPPYPYCARFAS